MEVYYLCANIYERGVNVKFDTSPQKLKNKRLIFALLAHQDEDVLTAQIDNIRYFNPNAGIVLYNGGTNVNFAKNMNVLIYPQSHPLKYGNIAPYFWEIMNWIETMQLDYDYIMNVDHDMLFIKHGFETFLDEIMKENDCIGWRLENSIDHPNSVPIESMVIEWNLWKPIFKTNIYKSYFNPGQVYTRAIVKRMLTHVEHSVVEPLIRNSEAYALEEVFFVTLAMACGGKIGEYPGGSKFNEAVRWGENITYMDMNESNKNPNYYWIHPIKGEELIQLSRQIPKIPNRTTCNL